VFRWPTPDRSDCAADRRSEEALDKVMFSVMVMTPAALRSEDCRWEWRLCSAARGGGKIP
jgi:hypothetical protein